MQLTASTQSPSPLSFDYFLKKKLDMIASDEKDYEVNADGAYNLDYAIRKRRSEAMANKTSLIINARFINEPRINQNIFYKYKTTNTYCSFYDNNLKINQVKYLLFDHNIDPNQRSMPLIPVLNSDWFHNDLAYLIEKNQIATNLASTTLSNATNFNKISDTLRVIELNDWGIDAITQNAFKRFLNLRSLRLSNNNLQTIELSAFSCEDYYFKTYETDDGNYDQVDNEETSYEDNDPSLNVTKNSKRPIKSQLIELDLSFNKLTNIKLENFMYLENLRVLNFSVNHLKNFDLRFIHVIAPKLQILDLSFNYLRKFQLLHNNGVGSKQAYKMSASSLILNDLVYLNLFGNFLSNFNELFAINAAYLNDRSFCDPNQTTDDTEENGTIKSLADMPYPFNLKTKGTRLVNLKKKDSSRQVVNQTIEEHAPFTMNIKNNTWKCDCQTFEILFSIISIQFKLDNLFSDTNGGNNNTSQSRFEALSSKLVKHSKSCYLNLFLTKNSFIFNNLLFNLNIYNIFDLSCFTTSAKLAADAKKKSEQLVNWFMWYNLNCVPTSLNNDDESNTYAAKTTTTIVSKNKSENDLVDDQNVFSTTTQQIFTSKKIATSNLVQSSKTNLISNSTNSMIIPQTTPSKNNIVLIFNSLNFTKPTATTMGTQQPPILKYDVSSAFYWVSSVCIAIIVVSCIFIVWFYCLKRYRISRRLAALRNNRRLANNATNRVLTNGRSSSNLVNRREASQTNQRHNNIYYLNQSNNLDGFNSATNDANLNLLLEGNHRGHTNQRFYSNQFRNGNWRMNNPLDNVQENVHGGSNGSNLYYISSNLNQHSSATSVPPPFENNTLNNRRNFLFSYLNNRDDEPPNYYEAILIKNNENEMNMTNNNARLANNYLSINSISNDVSATAQTVNNTTTRVDMDENNTINDAVDMTNTHTINTANCITSNSIDNDSSSMRSSSEGSTTANNYSFLSSTTNYDNTSILEINNGNTSSNNKIRIKKKRPVAASITSADNITTSMTSNSKRTLLRPHLNLNFNLDDENISFNEEDGDEELVLGNGGSRCERRVVVGPANQGQSTDV